MRRIILILLIAVVSFVVYSHADAAVLEWLINDGGNGHFYERVALTSSYYDGDGSLSWVDANAVASAMSYLGMPGHLVSITSVQENTFILNNWSGGLASCWIGAYQYDSLAEPSGHWRWVTDEPWEYTNWLVSGISTEPNESGNEDWAIFAIPATGEESFEGTWNDWLIFGNFSPYRVAPMGYFVEYESKVIPEPCSLLLVGFGLFGIKLRKSSFRLKTTF